MVFDYNKGILGDSMSFYEYFPGFLPILWDFFSKFDLILYEFFYHYLLVFINQLVHVQRATEGSRATAASAASEGSGAFKTARPAYAAGRKAIIVF